MLAPLQIVLALLAGAAFTVVVAPSLADAGAVEAAAAADPGVSSVVAGLGMMAIYVGLRTRRRR